jgi:AraC-like DNA-binding protein
VLGWTPEKLRAVADSYASEVMDRQSPPRVKELASVLQMPLTKCRRLFLHVLGEQPSSYLRQHQIESAKTLLRQTDWSMNVIAYKCGFGTRRTFFRAFRRLVGMTPMAYRRSMG